MKNVVSKHKMKRPAAKEDLNCEVSKYKEKTTNNSQFNQSLTSCAGSLLETMSLPLRVTRVPSPLNTNNVGIEEISELKS